MRIQKPLVPTAEYVKDQRNAAVAYLLDALALLKKGNYGGGVGLVEAATVLLGGAMEVEEGRPFPLTAWTSTVGEAIQASDIPGHLPHAPGDVLVFDDGVYPESGDYVLVQEGDDGPQHVCRYDKAGNGSPSLLIPVSADRHYNLRVCAARRESPISGESGLILGVLIASGAKGQIEPFVSFDLIESYGPAPEESDSLKITAA